ncbi:hypothetical protein [Bacillus toyonensis]|uniref:hypothetical protein n=1 Tax=Bacillus toyonensis TaxID=155322 RepID=UPI000BF02409|nr:hypothetical protein [Bacillus toyonensis]PEL24299.1 hypothetical protein CN624_18040 [Bacillus toyonensis]
MTKLMTLIGVGEVKGTAAGELKVGDITRWNYGGIERITSVEFSKTGKTIIVGIEYMDYDNQVVTSERKFRTTRMVNIIGRGKTRLTGKYNFRSEEEENLVAKYMSNPVFKYTEVEEEEEAPVLVETVKIETPEEVEEVTAASEVHEVGDMIVHPETKEIVTEDMFLSYPNWKETDFIKVTNCKETKTAEGVALTGEIDGVTFTATLSEQDYFNGKNFILPEEEKESEEMGLLGELINTLPLEQRDQFVPMVVEHEKFVTAFINGETGITHPTLHYKAMTVAYGEHFAECVRQVAAVSVPQ